MPKNKPDQFNAELSKKWKASGKPKLVASAYCFDLCDLIHETVLLRLKDLEPWEVSEIYTQCCVSLLTSATSSLYLNSDMTARQATSVVMNGLNQKILDHLKNIENGIIEGKIHTINRHGKQVEPDFRDQLKKRLSARPQPGHKPHAR